MGPTENTLRSPCITYLSLIVRNIFQVLTGGHQTMQKGARPSATIRSKDPSSFCRYAIIKGLTQMLPRHWSVVCGLMASLLIALCSCTHKSPDITSHEAAAKADTVPALRDADDAARFIAGLPGTAASPFASFEATDSWKEHRRRLDEAWRKTEDTLMSGLREFQKEELDEASLRSSPVFYPFGGPDALTPALYFPQTPIYVIVGLEPAGTLPTPSQIERKGLPKYLAEMRETVDSELSRSFFVTRQMDHQLRGQVTDGVLLPILHLLVRMHNTVLGMRYVRLDDQGWVIDRAIGYKAPGRFGNKGIEIEFRTDSEQSTHKLYYFPVNLSDERLNENKPFLLYLSRLKGTTTLLKATSYMTHQPQFSLIRDQILANSSAILQDDSGIPYRYFQTGDWNVQLFGDYSRPYGSFRWLEQSDLRKAYESAGAKPLAFHVGYGYSRITSNLLLGRHANLGASLKRPEELR